MAAAFLGCPFSTEPRSSNCERSAEAYMLIFAAIGANTDMTQTDTLIAPHLRVNLAAKLGGHVA